LAEFKELIRKASEGQRRVIETLVQHHDEKDAKDDDYDNLAQRCVDIVDKGNSRVGMLLRCVWMFYARPIVGVAANLLIRILEAAIERALGKATDHVMGKKKGVRFWVHLGHIDLSDRKEFLQYDATAYSGVLLFFIIGLLVHIMLVPGPKELHTDRVFKQRQRALRAVLAAAATFYTTVSFMKARSDMFAKTYMPVDEFIEDVMRASNAANLAVVTKQQNIKVTAEGDIIVGAHTYRNIVWDEIPPPAGQYKATKFENNYVHVTIQHAKDSYIFANPDKYHAGTSLDRQMMIVGYMGSVLAYGGIATWLTDRMLIPSERKVSPDVGDAKYVGNPTGTKYWQGRTRVGVSGYPVA
jgi:hypothetical protein